MGVKTNTSKLGRGGAFGGVKPNPSDGGLVTPPSGPYADTTAVLADTTSVKADSY